MTVHLEMGLHTFGDVTADAHGVLLPHARVIRNLIEQATLADELGIDFIGVGEHHRADFAVSAPEVVLAAIASCTKRIRLGSATTVLSSDDPIRVFERFATLDAASDGRAEVILGRGSFTESFGLFGFPLDQYESLFNEKLDLFATLLKQQPVAWEGRLRPPLTGERVFPPVEHGPLATWIGVGGSAESIVRAARYGLPLMLAVIAGDPRQFLPHINLHLRLYQELERAPQPFGMHSPGYVAPTDQQARDDFWPAYKVMHDRVGAERGWPPMQRAEYDGEVAHGSLYVGSPETVARRIANTTRALGVSRFDMKFSAGTLSHEKMMRCIELYGTRVIPLVREMISRAG